MMTASQVQVFEGTSQCHKNETQSLTLMKKLTSVCLSTILSLRHILPEDAFLVKEYAGLTLRFLEDNSENLYARTIHSWFEGAMDGVAKKFLKQLILKLEDVDEFTLEVYVFKFKYVDNSVTLIVENGKETQTSQMPLSFENIQEQVIELIRACIQVTIDCSPLPDVVNLNMLASYYDSTPQDYNLPGFKKCDLKEPNFLEQPRTVKCGSVDTNNHFLRIVCRSSLLPKPQKQGENVQVRGEDPLSPGNERIEVCTPMLNSLEVAVQPISCICKSASDQQFLLVCKGCGCKSHGACYGLIEDAPNMEFCCLGCHGTLGSCHDHKLHEVPSKHQQKLALLRRLMLHCLNYENDHIMIDDLHDVADQENDNCTFTVLRRLCELAILKQSKNGVYNIGKDAIRKLLPDYFYMVATAEVN